MEVEYPELCTFNHAGGSWDTSSGGWYGNIYFAWKFNTNLTYLFYNQKGQSDTWERLYNVATSKRGGYKFLGWYASNGTTEYQFFNSSGTLVYTGSIGDLYGIHTSYYAKWELVTYKATFNKSGGTGGSNEVYYNKSTQRFYSDFACTNQVYLITPPTREGYAFTGYYSGSTKYVNADGTFAAAFAISANVTLTAKWTQVSRKITLSDSTGTGGTAALYYRISGGGIYQDALCTTIATSVNIPSATSKRFLGYFSTVSGGTQYIDATGTILPALQSIVIASAVTIYAQWSNLYTVTLDKAGGTGGTVGIWYDESTGTYYGDEQHLTPITRVEPPTKAGNIFLGYFSAATGGTKYIDTDGSFTASFPVISSNLTFYAQWDLRSFVLTLNAAGGEGAPERIYYKPSVGWFLDESLSQSITAITVPTRAGYTFGGYFTDGVTQAISTDGTIRLSSILHDTTATASWSALSYTLSFNYNGGTPGVASKTVTMGQPVGTLPTTSKTGLTFAGWIVGTRYIAADTVWDIPANSTAIAEFAGSIGYHIDWFGLGSDALQPIASDSGDGAKRVTVYHTGQIEPGVGQTSGTWRNPSVTYRVVKDVTLNVTLGLAFPKASSDTTGYMITEVDVQTEAGQFPTVRISAVANEGANAINLFPISIPIAANAHAQRLMSAIVGDHLQSCSLSARCQPVVVEENLMPVASDVVAGKITVSATTVSLLPGMEYAPSAGSGFTVVGKPTIGTDGQCQSFNIVAERDMTKA